jgi:hypothetical protein
MFVGMFILFLFSVLVKSGGTTSAFIAANVLLWTVVLFVSLALLLSLCAVVTGRPEKMNEFLFPKSDAARVDLAVRVLLQICSGRTASSTTTSLFDPTSRQFRIESVTIGRENAQQILDGVKGALDEMSANQASRAHGCMEPYIPPLLALAGIDLANVKIARVDRKDLGASVTYYRKFADGSLISSAFSKNGIQFTMSDSTLPDNFQTNTIRCGPGTTGSAIKDVALSIVDNGGQIFVIERTKSDTPNVIYVLARATINGKPLTRRPLSRAQIATISECPAEQLSNLAKFEVPRPSGRIDDKRHVSFALDKDFNKAGEKAAEQFCVQKGFVDAVSFDFGYTKNSEDVAVHLSDGAVCEGRDCQYFKTIVCH